MSPRYSDMRITFVGERALFSYNYLLPDLGVNRSAPQDSLDQLIKRSILTGRKIAWFRHARANDFTYRKVISRECGET